MENRVTSRDEQAKSIFLDALEVASAPERAAYLDRRCGADTQLRAEVETLLRHHERLGDYLEQPACGPGPEDGVSGLPGIEGASPVIGPYKLLEPIGEGGMGVVYMAEQTRPVRRKVALKIIKPGMDTRQVVARFEAERQALAMMDHPNIARVLDAGATESGRPYFVMELVRGIPITTYCDQQRLPINERLNLFIQVCQAVQHAHQKGIIHRDLKPTNVLITLHDGVPVPKIIDFGVAKATGQSLTDKTLFTAFAHFIGTPLYMSPEQAEWSGIDVDTRSDIYSLGVLLYELLAGTTPFDQDTFRTVALDEMRRIIREEEPPKPSTRLSALGETLTTVSTNRQAEPRRLNRAVRGELDWIVMKALEKDRRRRYETANDFAADVMRYLTDKPVEACPPSAWYRFGKLARRHRAAFMTSALVVLALVVGTAVSTWQAIRATRAEATARQQRNAATTARGAEARARERAEDAEAAARAEADKATAINEFLVNDLLVQAKPDNNAVTEPVTLQTVLDRAAEKVGDRFRDRPLLEAALRTTIGETYFSLGALEQSQQQYAAALAIYERQKGPRAAETARAMVALGSVLDAWGRFDDAEPLLRQGLDGLRRALGEEHPDTLTAMNNLAHLYWVQERGKLSETEVLLKKVLEIRYRTQGKTHLDTLNAMDNLAMLYDSQGQLSYPPVLFPQGLEIRLGDRGKEHPQTAALEYRAGRYTTQGKLSEAEALLVEALEKKRRALGEHHPQTIETLLNLVQLYGLENKLSEAEVLLVRRIEFLRNTRAGGDDRVRHTYKPGLGLLYTLNLLTYNLIRQGRYAEAEVSGRELMQKASKDDLWFYSDGESLLGGALLGQAKYAEAEPLLLSGYEGLEASQSVGAGSKYRERGARWPRLDRSGKRIVQLYEAWGKPDKAAAWKARLGLAELPADVFAGPQAAH
jgi:serine/threonine protein kinase